MKITQVHVEYSGRLSTGNYGSEEWRIGLGADLEQFDDRQLQMDLLADICRAAAEQYLRQSRFRAIRQAISAREPDPTDDTPF